jgi:hemin uptake protein HemP
MPDRNLPPAFESAVSTAIAQTPIVYRSDEILQGRREIWIEHAGQMYRLRLTSARKLYLTK